MTRSSPTVAVHSALPPNGDRGLKPSPMKETPKKLKLAPPFKNYRWHLANAKATGHVKTWMDFGNYLIEVGVARLRFADGATGRVGILTFDESERFPRRAFDAPHMHLTMDVDVNLTEEQNSAEARHRIYSGRRITKDDIEWGDEF
jgi:hypothetical protein